MKILGQYYVLCMIFKTINLSFIPLFLFTLCELIVDIFDGHGHTLIHDIHH